jgi:N6-adenosine-specific RNA methylase IME4
LLFNDITVIKTQAENVILNAHRRIGAEIEKVPKASGRPEKNRQAAKNKPGRAATKIPKDLRSRAGRLAKYSHRAVDDAAEQLRGQGKDATPRAVLTLLTQGDKGARRVDRERALGAKIAALPVKRYGVIYADPPWRFEPYSRDTGMDRAADNHYPTMDTEAIRRLEIPAARDCVLFLWATVPMLDQALGVVAAWGFTYKSHFVWVKDRLGTGLWTRNKHELLLIGTRGTIPAPEQGRQYESVITAPVARHSSKPFVMHEMIEEMFPHLPRIELFARERFEGWDAWGNELQGGSNENGHEDGRNVSVSG